MSTLQSLAVFMAVAEEGSFSAAAKKLSLTQPTVSFHIDSLEKKLGCMLFTRTVKGATRTIYGETLYGNTREMQDIMARTENLLREMSAGSAGHITVGVGTIPGDYILPPLLAEFINSRAGISVELVVADSHAILDGWKGGKYSLAIVGTPPAAEMEAKPLWQDELLLVASPALASALPNPVMPTELQRYPWVFRHEGSGSRETVFTALRKLGIEPGSLRTVLEVGGNEALKQAVAGNAGMGFVSSWAVRNELASGSLVRLNLDGIDIRRQFYAFRRTVNVAPVVELLWEFLLAKANVK